MNLARYVETALPPSPEREELLGLVRLGLSFQQQQNKGRRPGPLKTYLLKLIQKIEGPVTFDRLLEELELEAVRRDMNGISASPIEQVNRVWAIVTYHHPPQRQAATHLQDPQKQAHLVQNKPGQVIPCQAQTGNNHL